MKKYNDAELDTGELLFCRYVGKKNAVSIEKLSSILTINKRETRNFIHTLRHERKLPIISLSSSGGYFLADPFAREEIGYVKHFIAEQEHRIKEIEKIITPAIAFLAKYII